MALNLMNYRPSPLDNGLKFAGLSLLAALLLAAPAGAQCVRTAGIAKSYSIPIMGPGKKDIPITLTTCTGSVSECSGTPGGSVCTSPATVDTTGSWLTVRLSRIGGTQVYSTVAYPIPARGSGYVCLPVNVPVNIPVGAPAGTYAITCTGVVRFSADSSNPSTLDVPVSGDTEVTYVPSGKPRVNVKIVRGANANVRSGRIFRMKFKVTNNDDQTAVLEPCLRAKAPSKKTRTFPVLLTEKNRLPDLTQIVSNKACLPPIKLAPHKSVTFHGYTIPMGTGANASTEYVFSVKGKLVDANSQVTGKFDTRVGAAVTSNHRPRFHWPWDNYNRP